MLGAVVGGHLGRQLHEHLVKALALGLGIRAGGPFGGLTLAQGLFHGAAVLVAGVGEADHQEVAAAPGGEAEVVVEPVGLVVDFVDVGGPGQVHAPVVAQDAGRDGVREVGEQRAAGALGQARHALPNGIEVDDSKVFHLANGVIDRA